MDSVRFLIVGSGHNVAAYLTGCVESIKAQTYTNYAVLLIDDCSTDFTKRMFEVYRKQLPWHFVSLNTSTQKSLGTVYAREIALKTINEEYDVIVWLDLDDKLMPNALEKLAQIYKDPNCWLTYGNYITTEKVVPFQETKSLLLDKNTPIRQQPFMFMHLRSFRKELYQKLTFDDLFPPQKTVYPDLNMLWCLMEMAGHDHITAVHEVLYEYNTLNPGSILNTHSSFARTNELEAIRKIQPKKQLKAL